MPPTPLRICPLIFGWRAARVAKLIFEISLGSWKHARGMAPSAREFAKLILEISLLRCPVFLVRLIEL